MSLARVEVDGRPAEEEAPPPEAEPELLQLVARLREALAGKPVDAVARAARVNRQTLRGMLNGRHLQQHGPRLDIVGRVARACGVGRGWLAYGEGPKHPEVRGG